MHCNMKVMGPETHTEALCVHQSVSNKAAEEVL